MRPSFFFDLRIASLNPEKSGFCFTKICFDIYCGAVRSQTENNSNQVRCAEEASMTIYTVLVTTEIGIQKKTGFMLGTIEADSNAAAMVILKDLLLEQEIPIKDHGAILRSEHSTFSLEEVKALKGEEVARAFNRLKGVEKILKQRDEEAEIEFQKVLAAPG
jgi:hypothetical protein